MTTLTDAFLLDLLQRTEQDIYRIALYVSMAMDQATQAYTTLNEVIGKGYNAGGQILTGIKTYLQDGVAFLDWDDPIWPNSTITARSALIFNASRSNTAVAVLDLGQNFSSTNGNFVVMLPEPTPTTAVISIGGR